VGTGAALDDTLKTTTMVIMSERPDSPSSSWPLATAKARLTQLVDAALAGTPQIITRHGEDVVIVIATKQYAKAIGQRSTIAEFFARSPLAGVDLDIERNSSTARPVDL
jgi:antitoxin Phd